MFLTDHVSNVWCDALILLILLNQDQDQLVDLFKAICSSLYLNISLILFLERVRDTWNNISQEEDCCERSDG